MSAVTWVQPSPLGPLTLDVGPAGLRAVRIPGMATTPGAGPPAGGAPDMPSTGLAAEVAGAFASYFAGALGALDELPVDLSGTSAFGREVLSTLRGTGPGALISYGELAGAIGRPRAARAVGRAVGANPVAIAVPCHRVLARGGSLGGYSAGLDAKRWLLAHEGHAGWRTADQASGAGSGILTPSRRR